MSAVLVADLIDGFYRIQASADPYSGFSCRQQLYFRPFTNSNSIS